MKKKCIYQKIEQELKVAAWKKIKCWVTKCEKTLTQVTGGGNKRSKREIEGWRNGKMRQISTKNILKIFLFSKNVQLVSFAFVACFTLCICLAMNFIEISFSIAFFSFCWGALCITGLLDS